MSTYWFLVLPVAVWAAGLVLVAGVLLGKEGIPRNPKLPKRIPGLAHEGELIAWDLYHSDVDVWQALYGYPAQPWGLAALTEPTAAYRTVGYEVPTEVEYVSEAAA